MSLKLSSMTKENNCKKYRYEDMMSPYDKLKSLPDSEKYLKPGVSFATLDLVAIEMADNQAAKILKIERLKENQHRRW